MTAVGVIVSIIDSLIALVARVKESSPGDLEHSRAELERVRRELGALLDGGLADRQRRDIDRLIGAPTKTGD